MLGVFLIRITAFPSFGSTENLADKARRTSFRYGPEAEWRVSEVQRGKVDAAVGLEPGQLLMSGLRCP